MYVIVFLEEKLSAITRFTRMQQIYMATTECTEYSTQSPVIMPSFRSQSNSEVIHIIF